ncbi:MAG TPA: hypothetical protein VGG34_01895 [Opitutaceae bacterium]|jgi:hypothetical protein
MGFDKDDPKPILDLKKRTTKVNIIMVAAVVVFVVICIVVIAHMSFWHG